MIVGPFDLYLALINLNLHPAGTKLGPAQPQLFEPIWQMNQDNVMIKFDSGSQNINA